MNIIRVRVPLIIPLMCGLFALAWISKLYSVIQWNTVDQSVWQFFETEEGREIGGLAVSFDMINDILLEILLQHCSRLT
jgi:hypothetical protein